MRCSKWICVAVAAALFGLFAPTAGVHAQTAPKAAKLSADSLVNYFEAVVFGSRADPRKADEIVVKWQDPTINLALEEPHAKIDPALANKIVAMVKAHAAALGKLTGKKFTGAREAATADFRIFFVRRADMGKIYGPEINPNVVAAGAAAGECYSIRYRKAATTIFKVIIVVNVERDPALTNSCLLKEMTQGIGLPHDSDAMRPSIFSKADHLTALSPQDQILVRTLYDPRLKPGMPRAEALKTARTVIAELLKAAK